MFEPFRNECELKLEEPHHIAQKLKKAGEIEVRNENKNLVPPFHDLVDEACLHYRSYLNQSWDPLLQQENDEINSKLDKIEHGTEQDEDSKSCTSHSNLGNTSQINVILSDSDICEILKRDKFMILRTTGQRHIL